MKKIYLTPKVKSMDIELETVLLEESGVGGETGSPGAGNNFDDDDENDY